MDDVWHDTEVFDLDINPDKPPFSIALPPPNITGNLHMGHALNGTLQDVLIRLKRMQGYNVLLAAGHGPCRHFHSDGRRTPAEEGRAKTGTSSGAKQFIGRGLEVAQPVRRPDHRPNTSGWASASTGIESPLLWTPGM